MIWLKAVPWTKLIANAPLILDGAKALANYVKKKPAASGTAAQSDVVSDGTVGGDIDYLKARLRQLEEEQRRGAELLKSMAEANQQATLALAFLRRRAAWNLRFAIAALVGLIALAIWVGVGN